MDHQTLNHLQSRATIKCAKKRTLISSWGGQEKFHPFSRMGRKISILFLSLLISLPPKRFSGYKKMAAEKENRKKVFMTGHLSIGRKRLPPLPWQQRYISTASEREEERRKFLTISLPLTFSLTAISSPFFSLEILQDQNSWRRENLRGKFSFVSFQFSLRTGEDLNYCLEGGKKIKLGQGTFYRGCIECFSAPSSSKTAEFFSSQNHVTFRR